MATQSLYRRYRPRTFSELKGQDHVVRALRDAVANGREGQAYLFSGPRGTGKTTSARVLAKVLNCDNPHEGEPCCECDSCVAVERGTSYDVHELDAASNNGVDAIRDLVEKASLGTPGRHKVYILDEVHMLSKAAEAALLKTLEEPPPHVVFVLATTDPQKMSDTIRSRTQHLQFHLLPADVLAEHTRWVAADAGIELSDEAYDVVLSQGGGSARDTLSALELMASTGGDVSDLIDLDEFVASMVDRDPGRVLAAMAQAIGLGRDPRTLTEELIRHLRNGFLALMAPELVQLPHHRVDEIAAQAQQLGPAALVRAIERLGSALVDMRHAPDPRILVEVALVQLTRDDTASDVDALLARVQRLEHAMKHGGGAAGSTAAGTTGAPTDPNTGRAVIGGHARKPDAPATEGGSEASAPAAATPTEPTESLPTAADPTPPSDPAATPSGAGAPAAAAAAAGAISVSDAWEASVKSAVKPLVRALYSGGSFVGGDGATWRFSVPNETHRDRCETHRAAVEAELSAAVGHAVTIELVVEGHEATSATPASAGTDPAAAPGTSSGPEGRTTPPTGPASTPPPASSVPSPVPPAEPESAPPAKASPQADGDIDLDDLTDAPPDTVKTPIDRLAEAFPGSELIDDRD